MENCNINSDTLQDKTKRQSVWRIKKNSSDNKENKTERQSVWRITAKSVLTLDKIKLNDNQYEELQQYQF